MGVYIISTEVKNEYQCNIKVEAERCFAVDDYTINVDGAILKFPEYTEVLTEDEYMRNENEWKKNFNK